MKKKIVSFFNNNPGISIKTKEIARKLNITEEHEYASLKAALHQLCDEEYLERTGKRYKVKSTIDKRNIVGTLQLTFEGYGFVVPNKSKADDIFISDRNMFTAFNGDTVEVSLFAKQKGKKKNLEGQIVRIVKRKFNEIVGTLHKSNGFYLVKPDAADIHKDFYISPNDLNNAAPGQKVIVGDIVWTNPKHNPEGKIVEILGKRGNLDTELLSIAKEFNLPFRFTEKVLSEVENITAGIDEKETGKRADFRGEVVLTIDPEDAKDFDDALSIETLENGNFKVGIHIADVSHYVKPNSYTDNEAEKRGNSVYCVGSVIPMLPERLSNNICSLVPFEDRLTYSVIAELTARGKLVDYQIKKSIINSKRRFTYDEVQEIIETGEGDFKDEVLLLNKLAGTLRKKRLKEGSINFFSQEIKFVLNEEGEPVHIIKKETKESNNLVEEFMLLANKIVALHIGFPKAQNEVKPFLYRVHDLPDKEKIAEFCRFVKSLGYNISSNDVLKPTKLNKLMETIRGKEEETVINDLAIRTMAKAVYSPDNIGHYGLGFKHYTHFTSPIRRYSDLLVHRMLYSYIEEKGRRTYSQNDLEKICEHLSFCERNSVEAERLSLKLKKIEYLQKHLGEEFSAIITGVTNFGLFVEITEFLAEGLVHIRDMEGDFYVYDEKKYSLIGKRNRKNYRLGDKVNVKLIRVDYERAEIDFLIVD